MQPTDDASDDNAGAIYGTTDPDENGYVMQTMTVRNRMAGSARPRNESASITATADSDGSATAMPSSSDKVRKRAFKAKPLSTLRAAFGAMSLSDRMRAPRPLTIPANNAPMSRAGLVSYAKADEKAEKRRLKQERERDAALARLQGASD